MEVDAPAETTARTAAEPTRRLRIIELGLVLLVAFSQQIALSLYALFTRANLYGSSPGRALMFSGLLMEIGPLAVLWYVLFRQGRSFQSLGLGFSWKDIPKSLLVILLSYVAIMIWWAAVSQGYRVAAGHALDYQTRNVDFMSSAISVWGVLFMVLNPFYEELIARAYVISEIQFLTGSAWLAVLFSVVLQASYHLYQGLAPALLATSIFTVFSLYYVKTKRITPVILAHMFFDLLALLRG
jgi:membrane protease YdiL (CAAX protease family)